MNIRHRARQTALQILYKLDIAQGAPDDLGPDLDALTPGTEARLYCEAIVRGVTENKKNIDSAIEEYSENWTVDRMAVVDRNILRVAVFELQYRKDVPFKVIIDEAVELAKVFGSEESGPFINGVLDKIHKSALERLHPAL